ncbi:MAG: nicotinamidase [Planctomycetaceae bacterium]|nr:nicotinamidase [Planctomycetaceae bacterium]
MSSLAFSADDLTLSLRYQTETTEGSGRYHRLARHATWKPEETAVIVCDVWDLHHSLNAVRRVEEFAPRLNELLKDARSRGMTIVHSPSDCMDAYTDHPARKRANDAPKAAQLPDDIQSWCSRIPAEEQAVYPLDQSDGGDDDDPAEHAEWAAKLKKMGRNVGTPWLKQSDLITIDEERDYISDRGDEVWNVLEARGIKNVILTGVHVNMCVLGRPFGLRQMARNGKQVVLVRDMTDTMYNPARWPYVSHFTGTDRIISHIEKFVCPTITSDQILGGKEFRFKHDERPHVVIVIAESEYETNRTLPVFVSKYLGKQCRVTLVHGSDKERNEIPGLEALMTADVAFISVRRRTLQPKQLAIVREFVAAGKPIVGIRTASHAFSLRKESAPEGLADWPEFDAQVFGGSYTNHHGNKLKSTVSIAAKTAEHPILAGIESKSFPQGGSLYMTSPVAPEATILLTGTVEGRPAEPVAWTYQRQDGGRSFYTSMGHPEDFEHPKFIRLLLNGVHWAADLPPAKNVAIAANVDQFKKHWSLMLVPASWEAASAGVLKGYAGVAWYRCSVRPRDKWIDPAGLMFELPRQSRGVQVWFNGTELKRRPDRKRGSRFLIKKDLIEANDANLLVVRIDKGDGERGWQVAPRVLSGNRKLDLQGRWQFRIGDDPAWSNIPLPARYGTSTDIVFEP